MAEEKVEGAQVTAVEVDPATAIPTLQKKIESIYNLLKNAVTGLEDCGAPGCTVASEAVSDVATKYAVAYTTTLDVARIKEIT